MKKTLHLTHTDIETDARILKEMGVLAEAGYEISGLGIELEEGAAKSAIAFKANIHAIRLSSRQLKFMPRILRHVLSMCELMFKMLPQAIRIKPNIVHCHDTLVLPLGVIVKLLTRAKLVYDAHELESDRNGLTKLQGLLTLWVERLLWRFVDALIVVSPSIQTWYLDNIGLKPSAVILNAPLFFELGVSHEDYLREKFKIPTESLIFIYVGMLGTGRGLELVTQAFLHQDVNSHIVFLGFGELSSQLEQLAKSNRRFHLHKAVPHSQVVPIVRSADFGLCLIENVSLSDYFCLPNKLFEYFFAGVPVLASNFPDIKKLVYEYEVGKCCDLKLEAIIAAIKELERCGADFAFKNLHTLTWKSQGQKLLELYRQVLSN